MKIVCTRLTEMPVAADLSLLVNPVVSTVGGTTPYLVRLERISSFTADILFLDRSRCLRLVRGATARGSEDNMFPDMSRVDKELERGDRLSAASPVSFED